MLMRRTIIVSNRLPVQVIKQNQSIKYKSSIGGLVTGLRSGHKEKDCLWFGWCGIENEKLDKKDPKIIESDLKNRFKCVPVFLSEEEIESFYNAFSNKTLWPLFHHFPMLTEYKKENWEGYQSVNRKFYKRLKIFIKNRDRIWIHDYHLLLLPKMIKDDYPDTEIGLFLHIPFPSFEIFRLLPWRENILNGMLGADLIGFHTYDYARHFISSIRRVLRLDVNLGVITLENREVHVDVFPMGIDYQRYSRALERKSVKNIIRKYTKMLGQFKIILSVDRLDYTKGIPNRLYGFEKFLQLYPEWREKVALILIVAPSRTDIDTYMELKKELDILVSRINSKYGTIGWNPISYFFRSFSFDGLAALYGLSDILLVTPLRDGMNLVVKEYIASRQNKPGVVIISETTGAVSELGEAIIVNSSNIEEIANAIHRALNTSPEERIRASALMNKRIQENTIDQWAKDFLDKLETITKKQEILKTNRLTRHKQRKLMKGYQSSDKRLLLLDYDGTLVSFKAKPELASPDDDLLNVLKKLSNNEKNHLVIISGRDKNTLNKWMGKLNVHLVAGHGIWIREKKKDWRLIERLDNKWKDAIRPILYTFVHRTPGSFVEEKDFSLAWHYRNCDPDFALVRLDELKATLLGLTGNLNIGILNGNKVLEIKDTTINKGRAAALCINDLNPDFLMAIGDDWTDEDMFTTLPANAYSIKVGFGHTQAKFYLEGVEEVRKLLWQLSDSS